MHFKSFMILLAGFLLLASASFAVEGTNKPTTQPLAAETGSTPPTKTGDLKATIKDAKNYIKEKTTGTEKTTEQKNVIAGYEKANETMHHNMMVNLTGNSDVDFVRGMIPHHQGAIDMAKVELQYGKDAEIKKLAKDIIAAQEKEIAMMQDWLKKNAPAN
jgi:uncharacterized protein (DUF305 family)